MPYMIVGLIGGAYRGLGKGVSTLIHKTLQNLHNALTGNYV